MAKKVHIIDYGYGNLFSLEKALVHLGVSSIITRDPNDIIDSAAVFLPGVGAFGDGINELRKRGFEDPILKHTQAGKPLFGICLGVQFLFDESEEFGKHAGLGIIKGKVQRIAITDPSAKIPHIGWNKLFLPSHRKDWGKTSFKNIQENDQVYFVHSYVVRPKDKTTIAATTNYGGDVFCSVVKYNHVLGTQFHPEKSGASGLKIYANFVNQI